MLPDFGSDHFPILQTVPFSGFALTLPSIFRTFLIVALLFTLTLTVLLQRNTPFLFSTAALFTSWGLNAAKCFIFFWPRQTPTPSR